MTESYLQYWGLKLHPFLMAPDSKMMYIAGQYFECLERLRYAVSSNKGGALLISEDAGLGKTTILLRLIEEMQEEYGDAFRYALVDHPTLNDSQLLAYITGCISGETPYDDKLKNLILLKDALINIQKKGGKSIIVVDEGQMLCNAKDILQELRVLINLTHNNEYLHTMILSGQRPLWNTIKSMPEFWQRLPVRYYLVPLQMEETKGLVRHRLMIGGAGEGREIFTRDALEIIHRYTQGSPRTTIALSDLSLLVGFTNRVTQVGYKEVAKAMGAMTGKGDSLPYTKREEKDDGIQGGNKPAQDGNEKESEEAAAGERPERKDAERVISLRSLESIAGTPRTLRRKAEKQPVRVVHLSEEFENISQRIKPYAGKVIMFLLIAGGIFGWFYALSPFLRDAHLFEKKRLPQAIHAKTEAVAASKGSEAAKVPAKKAEQQDIVQKEGYVPPPRAGKNEVRREEISREAAVVKEKKPHIIGEAVISAYRANIREKPDIESSVVAIADKGTRIALEEASFDSDGSKWYKVTFYNRIGWVSQKVIIRLREGDIIFKRQSNFL